MSELVNNAKSEVYAECSECMTTDGWLYEMNMGYESGAAVCLSCAKNVVWELQEAEDKDKGKGAGASRELAL